MIINNFTCPVCGQHTFKSNNTDERCPVCKWWNDIVENENPEYGGGQNGICLNDYRKQWQERQARIDGGDKDGIKFGRNG